MAFCLQAAFTTGFRRVCGIARRNDALTLLQTLRHTLESGLSISPPGTSFGSSDADACWSMQQAHACLDLVAMLTTGAARNEKFLVTVAFQRSAIRWIDCLCCYHC